MLIPDKNLRTENSLIFIGGVVLALAYEPITVSRLWDRFQDKRIEQMNRDSCDVSFEWFTLAVDLLYAIGAIDYVEGNIRRVER